MSNGHGDMDNEETERGERGAEGERKKERERKNEGMKHNMSSLSISPPHD